MEYEAFPRTLIFQRVPIQPPVPRLFIHRGNIIQRVGAECCQGTYSVSLRQIPKEGNAAGMKLNFTLKHTEVQRRRGDLKIWNFFMSEI